MSTTWEQLEGAALALVRSGPIKDRLADAYRNHLARINAEDLPESLRAEFRACHEALTHERPLRGEDAVRATVRKMSGHEADEVACTLVRLFAALVREETLATAPAAVLPVAVARVREAKAPATKAPKSVPQVISLYAAAESLS